MIIEMMLLFVILGMLSNAILHFIIKKGNFIVMLLLGATVGWFAGMLWIFLSPLSLTVIDIIATVIISMIPSLILIYKLPIPFTKGWHMPTAIATLLLLVFLVFSVFISLPQSYPSVANTQSYQISKNIVKTIEVTDSNIRNFQSKTSGNDILIYCNKANIQSLSTNATEGQYIEFRITFAVSKTNWTKPFITFGIFKDNDGDGKISVGDELWASTNYKIITKSGYWRGNLYYENNNPKYQIFSSDKGLLPIFHASQISVWKDDSQYVFSNTPEGYKPPVDMLSWDGNTLKENVLAYSSIPSGATSSIEGKIYCPAESEGKYYMVVRAYDARFTEPYNPSQPLAEKIIPFEISKIPKPEVGIDVMMFISILLPSAVILVKKWWK